MNQMLPVEKVPGINPLVGLLSYCSLKKIAFKNRYCSPKQLDAILLASFLFKHQIFEFFWAISSSSKTVFQVNDYPLSQTLALWPTREYIYKVCLLYSQSGPDDTTLVWNFSLIIWRFFNCLWKTVDTCRFWRKAVLMKNRACTEVQFEKRIYEKSRRWHCGRASPYHRRAYLLCQSGGAVALDILPPHMTWWNHSGQPSDL